MKGHSKKFLESSRPALPGEQTVKYCLKRLFQDKNKKLEDLVCDQLTYEELIGALLQARDIFEDSIIL